MTTSEPVQRIVETALTSTGGVLQNARKAIANAEKLIGNMTAQIYGLPADGNGLAPRRRGRKAKIEGGNGTESETDKVDVPGLIAAAGGSLSFPDICAKAGWAARTANLRLSYLRKTGRVTSVGKGATAIYSLPPATEVAA